MIKLRNGLWGILLGVLVMNEGSALPEAPEGKQWLPVPELTDDFDRWDDTKWKKWIWDYDVPMKIVPENSGVKDGNLWIKATLDEGAERWFRSSRVASHAQIKFPMYIECRMKNAHISAYTTFWLNNGNAQNRDEIDVCENNSKPSMSGKEQEDRPYTMYSQYFIVVDGDEDRNKGNFDNRKLSDDNPAKGVKWNEDYQVFGAWWIDEHTVQFYINGEPTGRVTSKRKFTRKQNVIWDLWSGDVHWVGGLPPKSDLLNDDINTMYVDWVRTYRLVGK
ncbi:MAG: family 16 glycosylhydrolase [Verrucomicrobiota bacterium]